MAPPARLDDGPDTAVAKNVLLNDTVLDGLRDILLARRPLSDLDQIVKDWQAR